MQMQVEFRLKTDDYISSGQLKTGAHSNTRTQAITSENYAACLTDLRTREQSQPSLSCQHRKCLVHHESDVTPPTKHTTR